MDTSILRLTIFCLLSSFVIMETHTFWIDGNAMPERPVIETVGPRDCRPDEWRCNNGECIQQGQYCDGQNDCTDFSDEHFCHRLLLKTYPDQQTINEGFEVMFLCRDEGESRAPVRWTRQGGRPLPPGSKDQLGRLEIPNIRLEHAGEYICEAVGVSLSEPGRQVSATLRIEPRHHSMHHPPIVCSPANATCMNGQCIPKNVLCNGYNDCDDGSDELNCHEICQPNEFKCNNNKCVLKTWLCDGENDCEDGSDESDICRKDDIADSQCSSTEYQCKNGQCILKAFQCDNHVDCYDESDEVDCTKPTVIQPPPPSVHLRTGETFNVTCKGVGVPTPLVSWRLNFGHIPEKCNTTSHNGFGVLTCPNISVQDSGAYSCELFNNQGSVFVTPDTILSVTVEQPVLIQ